MSARPIAAATVSFGLVSIPVKLYASGESSQKISFNWLHKDCGSRLKQQYTCPKDEVAVERSDMVKGYEFTKGQYVLFTPEELKAIEEKSSNALDITEFVPASSIGQMYLEKIYYMGPDKGGDRAYKLLSRVLQETQRVAVAKYSARGKGYLVVIRPMGDGLVMEQLRYPDEIRSFDDVPIGDAVVKDEELALARQLVAQASTDKFDPSRYQDEVRLRVMELIQRKVDGEDITVAPTSEPKTQIIDIMDALKASLAATKKAGDEPQKLTG